MTPPASVLSQTLQSITLTKIRETGNQRSKYESRKNSVLASASRHSADQQARIAELLRGVSDLYPEAATLDARVANIHHWLEQSRYDATVPRAMLDSYEQLLRSKLEVQSRRLLLAHLYARLVAEWMSPSQSSLPVDAANASDDSSIDIVDRQKERLQELCDKFESVVFEPLHTDETEIDLYINDMFPGDEGQAALARLRKSIDSGARNLLRSEAPFEQETLKQCISALLSEDLLSDEKQGILRDFLGNEVVLREIADVLNMRFADIEAWDWQAGEGGIPVLPRQQLNGKYRIWMDEDVLQAILIHYVGIQCCINVRQALVAFISDKNSPWAWHAGSQMSARDHQVRRFYLGRQAVSRKSVEDMRRDDFVDTFFLSQLPSDMDSLSFGAYANDGASHDNWTGSSAKKETGNIKQALLHKLATEAIMHRSLHGEVAVVQSDLQWFATGLSHTTIFAVMRFFGFPEALIGFFKKVLRAPLNMQQSTGATPAGGTPRTRLRGVPMAHAIEKLIGELILFVMDLAVNQESRMLLYRLHDDLWLVGDPARCAQAWTAMGNFAKIMGLEFNSHKTGSVYLTNEKIPRKADVTAILPKGSVRVGHLVLDPESGKWKLDHVQVDEHVTQLKKQLEQCGSVLEWVQTWNSCIGRFFSHTFGEPAFCFGAEHVDSILQSYRRMHQSLFQAPGSEQDEGNVVLYVKAMIEERFGVSDIPDAFVFLPEKLGGLGLRNPFVTLLGVRKSLAKETPAGIMRRFYQTERDEYATAKKAFIEMGSTEKRMSLLYAGDVRFQSAKNMTNIFMSPSELETFFSFEEYASSREEASGPLADVYAHLQRSPSYEGPQLQDDVSEGLSILRIRWVEDTESKDVQWLLQMFSQELREKYGGMRMIEEQYLPLGVLAMLRKRAVRWGMIL